MNHQFEEISNDEFRQSFHETITSIRNVCDQDRINEDNDDDSKKEHQNVGFNNLFLERFFTLL
jgi:hypothetical protein